MSRGKAVYLILLPTLVIALVGVIAVRELRIRELKTERAQTSTALSARAAETDWWKQATAAALPAFSHLMAVDDVEVPTVDDLDLTGEDAEYLRETLRSILPDGEQLSAERKSLEIMRFVCLKLTRKANEGSGSQVLKDGYGICGDSANAFAALSRRAGLPTRKVGLYNLPGMELHAAAEVYYDGEWHFFDPTFGIFFYSQLYYNGDGHVASLDELLGAPSSWSMLRVARRPWIGRYDDALRRVPIALVDDSFMRDLSGLNGFSFRDLYRTDLKVGFPVARRAASLLSYPLNVDLGGASRVMLGRIDGSPDEMYEYGHLHLGRYGFHTWTINGAGGNPVSLEYIFGNSDAPELIVVPLKGVRAVRTKTDGNRVHINMHVSDDQAIAVVFATRDAPLDAVEVRKETPAVDQ